MLRLMGLPHVARFPRATELRLLARLQELGYEVERRSPSEGGAGS
jgi:hypothetical protein